MNATTPLLYTNQLTVGIADKIFCRGLELTLRPGERLAILGRNGAGKSTILSVLAGLRAPQAGEVRIAGERVPAQRMAILANDALADGVVIESTGAAKVLLIAGQPLKEPIAQYGPFVMNTEQEIYQALNDFREGRLA